MRRLFIGLGLLFGAFIEIYAVLLRLAESSNMAWLFVLLLVIGGGIGGAMIEHRLGPSPPRFAGLLSTYVGVFFVLAAGWFTTAALENVRELFAGELSLGKLALPNAAMALIWSLGRWLAGGRPANVAWLWLVAIPATLFVIWTGANAVLWSFEGAAMPGLAGLSVVAGLAAVGAAVQAIASG